MTHLCISRLLWYNHIYVYMYIYIIYHQCITQFWRPTVAWLPWGSASGSIDSAQPMRYCGRISQRREMFWKEVKAVQKWVGTLKHNKKHAKLANTIDWLKAKMQDMARYQIWQNMTKEITWKIRKYDSIWNMDVYGSIWSSAEWSRAWLQLGSKYWDVSQTATQD